ncbi:MAG: FAD-binding protein [Minwuia sp.]|uniref:FAD-binding protein n=1 Tax=Minwuia sp. TaxID=2493630 RepID=UPI003A89CEA4
MTGAFKPLNEEHLRECVAFAAAGGEALDVTGLGSKRGLGRPSGSAKVLDLSAFAGIRLYEPEELVMTAGVATPLEEIEAALAAKNQCLMFEPPHLGRLYGAEPGGGSIGSAFACNLGGPRRFKAGAARDHLLGFRGVSGRAEIFKSGGRVVKNVTGYDLSKLVCGSHGTLAALSEVTFKVLPAPEKTWTVLVFGLSLEAAVAAMSEAAGSPHEVSGVCHLPGDVAVELEVDLVRDPETSVTAFRVEGPGPSVEHRAGALKAAMRDRGAVEELHSHRSGAFWREVRDVQPLLRRDRPVWRVSLPPSDSGRFIGAVSAVLPVSAFLDWAGGLAWLAVDKADDGGAAVIRAALGEGHATLYRGSDALRASVPVFQPQPDPVAALTRRIKEGFDPKGILNPGRMVEGV